MGFILTKMLQIGAAIIGAIAGSFIAVAVYNLFFFSTENKALLTALTVIFSLLIAGLSFRYFEKIVIYSTSFIGAYSFIRGVSLFAGSYPSEIQMIENITSGAVASVPWQFYLYLIAFLILFIGGCVFQIKRKRQEEEFNTKSA